MFRKRIDRCIGHAVMLATASLALSFGGAGHAQQADMSFFVTSTGSGKGADFGGLEGADKHCASLAAAAGAGKRTWRAYLSASASGGAVAVNARDRIGKGPWVNAKGTTIAKGVAGTARQQQPDQAVCADREGRDGQRKRRSAEPARHPHRQPAGRYCLCWRRGPDLRQLDQEWRRVGDGRPSRPHRTERRATREVLELLAPIARLQRRGTAGYGRSGTAVLLRRQLGWTAQDRRRQAAGQVSAGVLRFLRT